MVARPVAWNGGKSCVNPATQRLVEIGLPGNAFPLPDCELRENGIFDAVEPLHAQNARIQQRSEEHTSELQSLMRISYAVFCLKKKNNTRISMSLTKKTN